MLIYHPVQDANHCMFRALLMLENSVHSEIDINLYRLIDFYMLFPSLLKEIRPLPEALRSYRKVFNTIPEPYESLKNTKRIIHQLEPLQTVALQNLIAKDLVDLDVFKESKKIRRTDKPLPETLRDAIQSSHYVSEEWFRVVINELPNISFTGRNGLKKRSGLMEYRYDMEPA